MKLLALVFGVWSTTIIAVTLISEQSEIQAKDTDVYTLCTGHKVILTNEQALKANRKLKLSGYCPDKK